MWLVSNSISSFSRLIATITRTSQLKLYVFHDSLIQKFFITL